MDTYRQALDLMSGTPAALEAIVSLPTEALERRPGPESWSILDVMQHMLQVESTIGGRIRLMLREDEPLLAPGQPVAQPESPHDTLTQWMGARAENLSMLRRLTPEQLGRSGRHPRYGQITVREHAVEWAYHDLDHLRQMLGALQAALYPDIGVFQALYPKPE